MSRQRIREVMDVLSAVRAPTLVLHARDDQVCPVAEGRLLASGIPGAEFVELESDNHVLLEHEPAWARFCRTVLEFLGVAAPRDGEHRPSKPCRLASGRSWP
jgi:pimeloyl-ACP methyl ester carboxylesterase